MGPESAGAKPGPACYARGGERPACTDADLLLGYLDAAKFAGGKLELRTDLARKAVETHIARPLGLDVEEAAAGMYRVINSNMAHGVREITVKRGLDPREFPLVVAGGAGALHACMIAHELEIPTLVVPAFASTLCAAGMLLTDLQHDFVRSAVGPLAELAPSSLDALIGAMVAEGEAELTRESVPPDARSHQVSLDLRYLKQYHEVTMPVSRDAVSTGDHASIAAAFHVEHDRLYGYHLSTEGTGLELVNIRVRSTGKVPKPVLPRIARGTADPSKARIGTRRAYLPERTAFAEVPVYDGHKLLSQNRISGPALVERTDTTLFITQSYAARVDDHGTLVLEQTAGAR